MRRKTNAMLRTRRPSSPDATTSGSVRRVSESPGFSSICRVIKTTAIPVRSLCLWYEAALLGVSQDKPRGCSQQDEAHVEPTSRRTVCRIGTGLRLGKAWRDVSPG